MTLASSQPHPWYWCKIRQEVVLLECVETGVNYLILRDPKTDIRYRMRPEEVLSRAEPPLSLWEKMQSLWESAQR